MLCGKENVNSQSVFPEWLFLTLFSAGIKVNKEQGRKNIINTFASSYI
jgi:hypothetical protein